MNSYFSERISKMSDENLVDIIVNESDYVPEAISQVKNELRRRRIPSETYKTIIDNRIEVQKEVKRKSGEGLNLYQKVVCFCFPFFVPFVAALPLIGFLLPKPPGFLSFYENGYSKRFSQVIKYTLAGFIFWIFVLIAYI